MISLLVILAVLVTYFLLKTRDDSWYMTSRGWTWKHRYQQWIELSLVGVVYLFLVVRVTEYLTWDQVVLGSLLGAFPIILFESNRWLSRPHISVESINIVEYPERWTIMDPIEQEDGPGRVGVHIQLKNDGRSTAKQCRTTLVSDKITQEEYETRWGDGNRTVRDLAPGEVQEIDLLWVDAKNTLIETASPTTDDDEHVYPPGGYSMVPHRELSKKHQKLGIYIRGTNVKQDIIPLRFEEQREIPIPEYFISNSTKWALVDQIMVESNDFVIEYRTSGKNTLVMPDYLNLSILSEIEGYTREDVVGNKGVAYEDGLKNKYEIDKKDV